MSGPHRHQPRRPQPGRPQPGRPQPGLPLPGARLRKHSVIIAGHRTSISIEDAFWEVLREIAALRGLSLAALVADVDSRREGNLSSALRVYAMGWLRRRQPASEAERGRMGPDGVGPDDGAGPRGAGPAGATPIAE